MDALRPSSQTGFVSRLALFLGVSVLSGLLVAGLALPVVGGLGLAARESAQGFENLPGELETPPLPERSRILAADGSLIATFFYENRVSVPLADVAPVMRQAIVAIEDSRFYEHGGIDLRGTLRAFVNNQQGADVQGGSTLTQQYVKQVLLESAQNLQDEKARIEAQKSATEQSYGRKLRELRYAVALEEQLDKNQILERYLNIAYFGAGAYGVEAAARHYFSKSAKALTLPEAAMLAGIVQQPTAYDPTRHPQRALERRNIVLTRMAEVGYATDQQVAAAKATKPVLRVPKDAGNGCQSSSVPFFCDFVLKTLLNDTAFGKKREERVRLLLRGGLTITTTLDRKAQAAAQKALAKYVYRTDKVASAVVSVEPGTGKIKAMAVSRGYGDGKGEIKFNPATDKAYGGSGGFQAGSTFKPFVAAAALEKGLPFGYPILSPYQKPIGDVKTCDGVSKAPWSPKNESHSENGTYTMRTGIAMSVNTYFAQLEQKVGVCRPATIAGELGLTRADGRPLEQHKTFTLGTQEVSPLSMAEAYATFAARGLHCTSVAISRVVDPSGQSLKVPPPDCSQVLDQKIADGVNELLVGVIDGNFPRTGAHLSLGRPAAGKTGTTDSRVHVWFVGYTPDLATAVWAGNPSPGNKVYKLVNRTIGGRSYGDVCGGCLPGPIWQQTMLGALKGVPASSFVPPPASLSRGTVIRVPSVAGLTVPEAQAALESAQLRGVVSNQRVESAAAAKGRVAYTAPGEGAAAYPGQTILLYVSDGQPAAAPVVQPTITVPGPQGPPPGPGQGDGRQKPPCRKPNQPGCPTLPPPQGVQAWPGWQW
jgi:membrane peptidoglycan carboxypeptidase